MHVLNYEILPLLFSADNFLGFFFFLKNEPGKFIGLNQQINLYKSVLKMFV